MGDERESEWQMVKRLSSETAISGRCIPSSQQRRSPDSRCSLCIQQPALPAHRSVDTTCAWYSSIRRAPSSMGSGESPKAASSTAIKRTPRGRSACGRKGGRVAREAAGQ